MDMIIKIIVWVKKKKNVSVFFFNKKLLCLCRMDMPQISFYIHDHAYKFE